MSGQCRKYSFYNRVCVRAVPEPFYFQSGLWLVSAGTVPVAIRIVTDFHAERKPLTAGAAGLEKLRTHERKSSGFQSPGKQLAVFITRSLQDKLVEQGGLVGRTLIFQAVGTA